MLRIPITNHPTKSFFSLEDINSSAWGRTNVKKYGPSLVFYLTALTSGIESSNNTKALNKITKATGQFQFLNSTISRYKRANPGLPAWDGSPEVQLAYFMAAFPEYLRAATRMYNAAATRGLTEGIEDDPIAKIIFGFRLAYHIWHFINYDKSASTRKDVDSEIKPLVAAANAYINHHDHFFESEHPVVITRSSFNDSSFIPKEDSELSSTIT